MMKRVTFATALIAAMAAGPAFAQNTAPSGNASPSGPMANPPASAPGSNSAPIGSSDNAAKMSSNAASINYVTQQTDQQILGSNLIGASVTGNDNASIGEINDILVSRTGNIEGVVVGVGGFLGMGEKNVAVPFQSLQVTNDGNAANTPKLTLQVSKADLQNAPEFKQADDNDADSMATGSTNPATPPAANPNTAPAR
jgi:sporulation protein YlmC with PRC-barrel domain